MLSAKDLAFAYPGAAPDQRALESVDVTVPTGEMWALIGPSGCGKSTFLYLAAGLLRPTAGSILFDDEEPAPLGLPRLPAARRRDIALILQEYGLFPWKTVRQNVTLGLAMRGVDRRTAEEKARAILEELGLWELRGRFPRQLSGGQKQRVAIARSLVTAPSLLLMDEPFSALDALTREKLQNLLLALWRSRGFTVLLVTHSIEEAVFLGRRIALFSAGPGRIEEVVDNPGMGAEEYRSSEEFLARANYIRSRIGRWGGELELPVGERGRRRG